MSRLPATRRSGRSFALPAPSRICRWLLPPADSWSFLHQVDEDVLKRVLHGIEVAESDSSLAQVPEQRCDAGALALRIISVYELTPVAGEFQVVMLEFGRNRLEWIVQ